jgi:hypothetical protein
MESTRETCSWCGEPVESEDGFRLAESPGERRAVFCRLEHFIPWFIQGPHWDPGEIDEPAGLADGQVACAQCGDPLSDVRLLLVRNRGEHRIPDAFCSLEHLADWAKAGGRYG